jgi:hypothetical protein
LAQLQQDYLVGVSLLLLHLLWLIT